MAPAADDAPAPSSAPPSSLAQDLFADMGRQVHQMSGGDDHTTTTTTTDPNSNTEQRVVDEIESLCMNCQSNGTTRLLLTRIPFFREIVIMSFACPHCHFANNEIQSAGAIQPHGARYALRVDGDADLQRQVVKSDICVVRLEEVDLEVPGGKGQYTNIEGLVAGVKSDLESHQGERMRQMPDVGAKVAGVIATLAAMLAGERYPFTVSADDPSGNSSIEPRPGDAAGKWVRSEYPRTPAQNAMLGLGNGEAGEEDDDDSASAPATEFRPEYRATGFVGADTDAHARGNNVDDREETGAAGTEAKETEDDIVENQVYTFPASCPGCTRPCETNMKMVRIPYFQQVVLMSTVCHACGYRSNEVKTGGAVPEQGKRTTLRVRAGGDHADLSRDILKSESAALLCPELQLRVEPGTMGGRFTTVEGILTQIRKDLRSQAFGLEDGDAPLPDNNNNNGGGSSGDGGGGDSMTSQSKERWESFFASLTDAIEGRKDFTLILEDPLAGSYIQSFTAPEPDPQIDIVEYDRTEEEEEDLGLKDIKTEGYEQDEVVTTA